jgi:NAD(P)-dependent dehydrogenase (short-subunit alcohol dehydrogenase family)
MPEPIFSLSGKRVFVAGHRGMVGSAIVRRLARERCEILTAIANAHRSSMGDDFAITYTVSVLDFGAPC